MKCPCCKSEDLSGLCHVAVICWDCYAQIRWVGDSIEIIDCSCGKHDEGKIIKEDQNEKM